MIALLACFSLLGCAGSRMRSDEASERPSRRGLFAFLSEGRSPASAQLEAKEALNEAREGRGRGGRKPTYLMSWPLAQIAITSPFGARNDDFHEGVDLKAAHGTPVYAAQSGSVIYAGSRIRGYGKMVVIKGAQGVSTVYAHNSRLLVRKGARVREGQKIALSGNTGRSSGPHLHFEVRKGVHPVDPMTWLAKSRRSPNSKKSARPIASSLAREPKPSLRAQRN